MRILALAKKCKRIVNDYGTFIKTESLILSLYKDLAANESEQVQLYIKQLIEQLEEI